jgi:hypothetical protein
VKSVVKTNLDLRNFTSKLARSISCELSVFFFLLQKNVHNFIININKLLSLISRDN